MFAQLIRERAVEVTLFTQIAEHARVMSVDVECERDDLLEFGITMRTLVRLGAAVLPLVSLQTRGRRAHFATLVARVRL